MRKHFLQFNRRQDLRRSLFSLALLFGIFGSSVLVFGSGAFANDLTYQTSVPVEFTFNDYLSITVSGDLVISDLAPGTFADSNHIAVTVNTNNAYGYTLSATVGDTNNSSRDLRHSGYGTGGNTEVFSNLDLDANLTRETFSTGSTYDNKWGFSIDKAGSAYSGKYNGLPLYTNTEDTVVLDTSNYMPTDGTSTTNFWIGAKASNDRIAGTYANVVNFMVVGGEAPIILYDEVAKMSKGKQTLADLQEAIETPTSASYTTDESNSGVYEYDSELFGTSSDLGTRPIYYYRGILENNPGTYGSEGSAITYPNYVKLANNTCWRIVRTTGSGGVKMIYNGTWSGSTCARSQSNAQVTTQAFASRGTSEQSSWYNNIHYVGYTFNKYITDATDEKSVDVVFGGNSNISANNTRSNIKTYIEDTWYANNMTAYTSKLESSAGYCNDRSAYSNAQLNPTPLTTIVPYKTSSATMYFGARERVAVANALPTLGCPRGEVDLYHYVANSTGVSNELKYPVALLTADEAALAGSGYSSSTTPYSGQSYLRSGSYFWLLSPFYRSSSGYAHGFLLNPVGNFNYLYVNNTFGVRPSISLNPGTLVTGGIGTATNPWTVE